MTSVLIREMTGSGGCTERGLAEEKLHAEGSTRGDRGLTGVLWLQAQEPPLRERTPPGHTEPTLPAPLFWTLTS